MENPNSGLAPNQLVQATFREGCFDSLPIVIGYIPVAFAFGMNTVRLGFSPLDSLMLSCLIYAGASQFVLTALISAGSSLWLAALTVMAMDVRHVLYGPTLRHYIQRPLSGRKTALWAFGLTDEVFAAAVAKLNKNNRRWSENWMLSVALCSWGSWVLGTAIGALCGNGPLDAYPAVEAALSFMLPALFLSFLLAAFHKRQGLVLAMALTGALAGLMLASIPMAILAGIGGGCFAALARPIKQPGRQNP